jgi:hypothetical protein
MGLDSYVARWYDSYLNHWVQPDSIIPDATNPMDYDRYAYTRNNPLRFTDSSGHCIDGITTVACLLIIGAVVLKVVDYGWTAYDTYQSSQVLADPNATQEEKDAAAANIAMAIAFEAAEPDELLPVSLPLDDLARKELISVGKEVGEEAGEQAVKDFTASNFRKNLQKLTGKAEEDIAKKEAHHVLPQEFFREFQEAGIENINNPQYGSWVDKGVHQGWSRKYNDDWRKFLKDKPK